uniref:SGNH hydrolase-type esterase domain-containing protein n=1 Tax=Astyanax mexicanus TaxID=7994 RepID=A0A3B1JCC9_ASTMX
MVVLDGNKITEDPHKRENFLIRLLNWNFDKYFDLLSCFPGARVLDVARRLPTVVRHRGDPGTVILHVGTNDTSARRSEVLKEHFRTLLDTARRLTRARLLISGPMPTYRRGSQPFSRLYALHCWLRDWCSASGVGYVDNWESFPPRRASPQPPGIHQKCPSM